MVEDILKLTSSEGMNYKKWEALGLLDGLDEETAKKVAVEYEKMAKYILRTKGAYMDSVTTCAFPAVRIIYSKNGGPNELYNPRAICDEINRLLKDMINMDVTENLGVDCEAEVTTVVSDYFSKKYEGGIIEKYTGKC